MNSIQIITNTNGLPQDHDDFDYTYDDIINVINDSGEIIHTIKTRFHIENYKIVENYAIFNVYDGNKYSDNFLFLNLNTFKLEYESFMINKNPYIISFRNDKIHFKNKLYDISYFFDNVAEIEKQYLIESHKFDITRDTLLLSIFNMFNKEIKNNSQVYIDGFTFGMSCQSVENFKNVLRDHTMSIEKQLTYVLFKHSINTHDIYDIDFTITYYQLDGNNNKIDDTENKFRILLECTDKKIMNNHPYGKFDENAQLQLIQL